MKNYELIDVCYLCGNKNFIKKEGRVRDNPDLQVLECTSCGLVFLSSFSHITNDFYELSKMHSGKVDIKAWVEETAGDDARRFAFLRKKITGKTILDFGCGNGGFLLRAKKNAKNVQGIEPDIKVAAYFRKKGLQVVPDLNKVSQSFDVITLFHVLEHIPDPRDILYRLSKKLKHNGHIIVEVPNADDALIKIYKNDAFMNFTYWSCHLFLYTKNTLSNLAKQVGLKINYIKQIQRYPLSNHLHWLSNGKPGGHKKWHFIDSVRLNKCYETQLAAVGCCDTIIASFSMCNTIGK